MGENIQNWFNNDELKKLVEKFGTTDKKEIQNLIKEHILKENTTTQNIDDKIKQLRARRLEAQCRIDEHRATYLETFGSMPTPQAEKAIKTYANNRGLREYTENRELTPTEYENVNKYISIKYENHKWLGKCDICQESETWETQREATLGLIQHLTVEHAKKVMMIR